MPPPPPKRTLSCTPFAMHNPFRNNLCASESSESCIFISQERMTITSNTLYQLIISLQIIRGGGALPLLTVVGTCRWTGYDFPVITIDTGYLNRPNWLLAGYSVYHRVASQPTMFMTGPQSRHQRCDGACGTQQIFMKLYMMIHSRIESPSVPVPTNLESTLDRELSPPLTGYAYESF